MALGLMLQWLMSLIIAAIYGAAAVQMPVLFDKPVRFGALYGVGVFIVMSFIVVPLSAAYPRPQPSISGLVLNLAANMLFGVIVASTPSLMRAGRRTAPILRGRTVHLGLAAGTRDDGAYPRRFGVLCPLPLAFATADRNAARESGSCAPLGANRSRARKKPVRRKPSAMSSALGRASRRAPSRKKAGSGRRRSRHGAPASALTARPDFGDT